MAFTIYTQSKIAKEWKLYLQDCENYFKKINEIAKKSNITDKERQRVKLMLEILIDEYKNLKPSLLIDDNLKQKSNQQYLKAKELYEKVFK
jgi:predicted transcriptional regulator